MLPAIQNTNINNYKSKQSQSFKGAGLPAGVAFLDGFIKTQENLSITRCIQSSMTNIVPKAALSRSKADFCEFTFLELLESGLFYFAAPFFGEFLYRRGIFKSSQPKNLRTEIDKNLPNSIEQIKNSKLDKALKNRIITQKGGMVLACLAIPVLEYALSFAKNLFTLKVFKISDFNNIANLNKDKKEDTAQQKRVETHAKYELKKAGVLSATGVAAGLLLSAAGHKSKGLVKFSEFLLEPGQKISKILHKAGISSPRTDRFLEEYLKLDFANRNGKLALSKGQLAAICTTGLFGYSAAAKDRGKLDFYEVWTRVPLVVLYTIFGSSVLDEGFKSILARKGKFPELIKRDSNGLINVPSRAELPQIAKNLSEKNNTSYEKELSRLIKQKSVITGVPYLFGLLVMGFTLTGITRVWTKYRYNQMNKDTQNQNQEVKKN